MKPFSGNGICSSILINTSILAVAVSCSPNPNGELSRLLGSNLTSESGGSNGTSGGGSSGGSSGGGSGGGSSSTTATQVKVMPISSTQAGAAINVEIEIQNAANQKVTSATIPAGCLSLQVTSSPPGSGSLTFTSGAATVEVIPWVAQNTIFSLVETSAGCAGGLVISQTVSVNLTNTPFVSTAGFVLGSATAAAGGTEEVILASRTDSYGKTWVVGYSTNASGVKVAYVARYLLNGTLDTSFATDGKWVGKGDSATPTSASSFLSGVARDERFSAIVLEEMSGSAYIGGQSQIGSTSCDSGSMTNMACRIFVIKMSADGSLDSTFNSTGLKYLNPGPGGYGILDQGAGTDSEYLDQMVAMQLNTSGRITFVANAKTSSWYTANGWTGVVGQLKTDGSWDTDFGLDYGLGASGKEGFAYLYSLMGNGGTHYNLVSDLAIHPTNGKIAIVGFADTGGSDNRILAIVLNGADGSLNTGFNSTGFLIGSTTDFAADGAHDRLQSVTWQNDKIIACGGTYQTTRTSLLLRLSSDGSYDTSFSSNGYLTAKEIFGASAGFFSASKGIVHDECRQVKSNSSGDVFVQGITDHWFGYTESWIYVSKFSSAGALQTAFGASGVYTSPSPGFAGGNSGSSTMDDFAQSLWLNPYDDKLTIAGSSKQANSNVRSLIFRLSSDGDLDL